MITERINAKHSMDEQQPLESGFLIVGKFKNVGMFRSVLSADLIRIAMWIGGCRAWAMSNDDMGEMLGNVVASSIQAVSSAHAPEKTTMPSWMN